MWILHILPETAIHMLLLAGVLGLVASFVFKFVPFVSTYSIPIQAISILVTVGCVYFEGGIAKDKEYQLQFAEMDRKVVEATLKSNAVNTKTEYIFLDKIQVVKQNQIVIQERIKEVAKTIDAECKVDPLAIGILNDAAKLTLSETK